jgi:hypothetical protein
MKKEKGQIGNDLNKSARMTLSFPIRDPGRPPGRRAAEIIYKKRREAAGNIVFPCFHDFHSFRRNYFTKNLDSQKIQLRRKIAEAEVN